MSVLVFNYYPWFIKEFVGSIRRFYQLISDHLTQIPSYGPPGFHVGTGMSFFLPLSLLVFWYTYPCSLSLISSLFLMATFNIWYRLALESIEQLDVIGDKLESSPGAPITVGINLPFRPPLPEEKRRVKNRELASLAKDADEARREELRLAQFRRDEEQRRNTTRQPPKSKPKNTNSSSGVVELNEDEKTALESILFKRRTDFQKARDR